MEKDYKLEALNKSIENAKRRGYRDYLYQLEIQLSTFIVPSYSDFVNSLKIASKELQNRCDDFDINDGSDFVSGFLFDENHKYTFSRKLFQIEESIYLITKITPKALPILRSHFDQLTNNIIAAIFEAGHNAMPKYYPLDAIGRAWDNMKRFYKLTQNEPSSLMELIDEKIPDRNAGYAMAVKLVGKYEKWISVDTSKQPKGYTWMRFRRAIIYDESYKNLYEEVMDFLLYTENIDSIDKISRIHGELWEIIINTPKHYENENDIVLIENAEMNDKAQQLAASIRVAIKSIKAKTKPKANNTKRWTVKLANEAILPIIVQHGKTPTVVTARFLEEKTGCPKSTLVKTENWKALKNIKKKDREQKAKLQQKPVHLSEKMLSVAEKTERGTVKLHNSHKKKNIEGDD